MEPAITDVKLLAVRKPSGLQASLKAREGDFLVAGIVLLSPNDEGDEMNLTELRQKSTAELRDLYNELAKKNLKRFESRTDAERRAAAELKKSGRWTGPLPGDKKSSSKAAAPKAVKAAKTGKAAGRPVGANTIYRVINEAPKMNSGSARTRVFLFIKEHSTKSGIDTETVENAFVNDEALNVRAVLTYLTKVKILEVVKAAS